MYWLWSILLLALGLGLAVSEVFFPSAGILGFLAAAAIIGAAVLGFQHGPWFGAAIVFIAGAGVPGIIILAFRVLPHTSMGRKVLLQAPRSEDVLPNDAERQQVRTLLGKVGRTRCKMLPGGVVEIEGESFEAVSEGTPIESGQIVRVVQVQGTRLVVRPTDEEPALPGAADPLRRPIDSVVPDPFDERAG